MLYLVYDPSVVPKCYITKLKELHGLKRTATFLFQIQHPLPWDTFHEVPCKNKYAFICTTLAVLKKPHWGIIDIQHLHIFDTYILMSLGI